MKKGYTLIEILVVVVVFAVISLIATQTVILILRGTKKAESVSKVRQNLDYAMGSMERQLRSARSITSACNNSASSQINFIDQSGNVNSFSCVGTNQTGSASSVASSSADLTSSDITISSCSFVCAPATSNSPPSVTLSVTGSDITRQGASVTVTTQVTLRSY